MGAGRTRRTAVILIVLILVVILIGVAVLFLLPGAGGTAEDSDAPQAAQAQPTAAPTIRIVAAARDIRRGSAIEADDLEVMPWPVLQQAPPPLGVIVAEGEGEAGLGQVTGRIARVDILAGSPVLENMITQSNQATDLGDLGSDAALLVPSGRVAIAVPVSRLSQVAYALREGDHVDVLMSFRFIDVDDEFQTELPNNAVSLDQDEETGQITFSQYPVGREERGVFGNTIMVVPGDGVKAIQQTTQLVIDNAIVLHVGNWPLTDLNQPIVVTPAPTPVPEEGQQPQQQGAAQPTPVPAVPAPDVLTLVMSRQDALVMKYAAEQGARIDLALRSAADDNIEDIVTDPVTLSYIINTRNVTPPEKLPVALDPRIDMLNELNTGTGSTAPAEEGAGS